VTVYFNKKTGILDAQTFEHELSFDGNGSHKKFVLTINKSALGLAPAPVKKVPNKILEQEI
jgi:hypothetical protein